MARLNLSRVAVPVLIALLSFQAYADEVQQSPEQKSMGKTASTQLFGEVPAGARPPSVLGALKDNLTALLTTPANQPIVAASFLMFGFACLIDGARSFALLVVVSVGVVTSCIMLTQLESLGRCMSVTASVEIGVFVAFAAFMGWQGTQLLLGLPVGFYLYHLGCGVIALVHDHYHQVPLHLQIHEANNTLVVAGYTASIIVGTFLVNDNGGAQRAFAIIAPLVGGALVAATAEYMLMFYGTTPQGAAALRVHFEVANLPSIFDLLYMIVFPFHSRPVGFFTATHGNIKLGDKTYELDKIIGVTAWVVFAVMGVCNQCKQISKLKKVSYAKEKEGDSLNAPLLDESKPTV